MRLKIPGEDFSDPPIHTEGSEPQRRGRPSEIDPEKLQRQVPELQFVLEQNWGAVGWLLLQAKTTFDVQTAFRSIVNPQCSLLELFISDRTLQTAAADLRKLRKSVKDARVRYRREFAMCRESREKCERAFQAWAAEHDPVKLARIQVIRPRIERDYEEAKTLEKKSQSQYESLEFELKGHEAHFAQSEILKFIQSNRRQFTPLNVARAMAGLPFVTARGSCELCTKHGIDPPPGMAFDIFRTIQRAIEEPIRDLGRSIDSVQKRLLSGPDNGLPHSAELRNNWYFLQLAIRSAVRDIRAPFGSLAFRVFAEYSRTSSSHSIGEALLPEAQRLALDGDNSVPQRGPQWSKGVRHNVANGTGCATRRNR